MAAISTLLQALYHANHSPSLAQTPPKNHSPSLAQTPPKNHSPIFLLFSTRKPQQNFSSIKCTTTSDTPPNPKPSAATSEETEVLARGGSFPGPGSDTTTTGADTFPIEKRRPSVITRDRRKREGLVAPEPPNFEIGWKRTKEIKIEKPKGWVIADFLVKLETLMGMEFGTTELLAKTGEIVAERAREETEVLREKGDVDDQMVTELYRVLRLLEMDLAMVKAAKKETVRERLEQAKTRCSQAILVALSF